ncbi:hypothetical protein H2O64_13570 [Kordia sp. YSTF-M3]|uniref:Uncharacterized protein n=1 Tax=Kordia aestuariivivens TaxID=2759037 RepID=A0ABR7QAU3_9FLAO|nr:hypothetical protein [Kordia aestuariivivens]MBC8755699.1 hypothetical protein [Kordia aestuariivivens]
MSIFNRKLKKKHLQQFERNIAELLATEMPQLKTVIDLSEIAGISFMYKPKGIYIQTKYNPEDYKIINRNHKTCFNLTGISVFHKKEQRYQPVKLYYQSDGLTKIEVENPEYFHKIYDLTQIRKGEIELEHLPMENPDQEIVERILKSLTQEQRNLLELEYSFEIELNDILFYTILDMEDGNYIAVDKKGNVYRLIHDHEEIVKLIARKPTDFFEMYNGQKSELDELLFE